MRDTRRDRLETGGLTMLQIPEIAFSLDAVLLGNFVRVRGGERALDLGTGTGVIPLLLAAKTKASLIVGLEILPDVVAVARRNVEENGLTARVEIVQGDLRECSRLVPAGGFEVVTANPPYHPLGSGRLPSDPRRAAARHEVFGTLLDVVAAARHAVAPGGRFAVVASAARELDLRGALRTCGFTVRRYRAVLPREGAAASLILVEAVPADSDEAVEPPLVVYEPGGAYSPELQLVMAGEKRLGSKE